MHTALEKIVSHFKKMNKNTILTIVAVVAILITGGLILASNGHSLSLPSIFGKSDSQIAKDVISYINDNKLASTPATMESVSEVSGLVKIKIKIGTQSFDSYATKDGKLLFPQAFEMKPAKTTAKANTNTQTPAQTAASVKKSDSPMLEAFVVARCPFGLQMQRAMAEAVKNASSLAQYIKVRYIGSVSGNTLSSMHGAAEGAENLRQICIREEQPAKYWGYVSCQMKASGTEVSCEKSTGVDSAKLASCISDKSRGLAYAQKDFDLADKFNVSGSPTMILNGAETSETGFGGRSADGIKSMVCAAFNTKSSFCSKTLTTDQAATSFSLAYSSGSGSAASSGSGANCGAAQ